MTSLDGASRVELAGVLPELSNGILVDSSITDAETGEPGFTPAREALERGVSVVFASKGPLVARYQELSKIARERGARIGASAAVGIPLPTLEVGGLGIRGANLRRFRGNPVELSALRATALPHDRLAPSPHPCRGVRSFFGGALASLEGRPGRRPDTPSHAASIVKKGRVAGRLRLESRVLSRPGRFCAPRAPRDRSGRATPGQRGRDPQSIQLRPRGCSCESKCARRLQSTEARSGPR